jgi:hypothetical protein
VSFSLDYDVTWKEDKWVEVSQVIKGFANGPSQPARKHFTGEGTTVFVNKNHHNPSLFIL